MRSEHGYPECTITAIFLYDICKGVASRSFEERLHMVVLRPCNSIYIQVYKSEAKRDTFPEHMRLDEESIRGTPPNSSPPHIRISRTSAGTAVTSRGNR